MSKEYRLWTVDGPQPSVSCLTDWMTRSNCRNVAIGRWGHIPPFAYISKAKSDTAFCRANRIDLGQ